ncbi:MAG: PTS glucitol/sorbitol transporter subunit IIB [Bacillota bacterium]
MYRSVIINRGSSGWGGPLVITPTEEKNVILSVTGGGIDELTKRIAELTGGEAVDGFSTAIPDAQVACAVVDCGGTARCGVYPKKGILTVNTTAVGQAGPLAKFIKEEIYVSDVKLDNVELADKTAPAPTVDTSSKEAFSKSLKDIQANAKQEVPKNGSSEFIAKVGKVMGGVVAKFYQAGRESIDMVIRNVLPFMAFVAMIIGIVTASGLGDIIANTIAPLVGSLPGMVAVAFVCSIPLISPILGPGAVIAQIVGTLVGTFIGEGAIVASMALPALFAIDAQVGCDFIPVGLSLGEAESETVAVGVPAVMFSRLITGPAAVLIAYAFSIGMY